MGANEITSGIGLRHVRVAERDTDGTMKVASGTAIGTAYAGLRIGGSRAFTITVPDAVRVPVAGDDRIYHTWQLPPTENSAGELRVSKFASPVVALVTGTKHLGSPNRRKNHWGSDKQGEEPNIVIWGSQQVVEADKALAAFGQKRWLTYFILNGIAHPRPHTMEYQTVTEMIYSVVANDATVTELGEAFTETTHGCTSAEFISIVTNEKYMFDAFLGDAAQLTFTLSQTPYESGVFNVTLDGVVQTLTTNYTRVTNVITMLVAPGADAKLLVEYEYE